MDKVRKALQSLGYVMVVLLIVGAAGLSIVASHIFFVQPQLLTINDRITGLERFSSIERIQILDVTAYSATKRQTDNDPDINASMQTPRPGDVAVSRDLFDNGWVFGRKVWVECFENRGPQLGHCGLFTINDVMNSKWEKRIDIYFQKTRHAWKYGKKRRAVALLNY